MAAALLLAYAAYRVPQMPVDVFPELNAPTVVVLTEAGGLAADEVELYVTFPIEASVNGLPGVRRVRSSSAIGLSLVWVEFDWGADIFRARQLVSERLSVLRESLPENAHAEITPITSITGEIMLIALSSPDGKVSDLELRALAEFDLRNRLLAVPGIAQVVAIGGELPEYQINVHQDRLALYGLTVNDVVEAARGAHSTAAAGWNFRFGRPPVCRASAISPVR
jgi:Cu/Ag efflux pump CusA